MQLEAAINAPNRVAVSFILRPRTFNPCHEAKYRNILRTHFPLVVESIRHLFVSGTVRFPDAVRDIGYLFEERRALDPALPYFIHYYFGHRNRWLFVGQCP